MVEKHEQRPEATPSFLKITESPLLGVRAEQWLTDTNIWQRQVQVEWGEPAHTCLLHLTSAPFSMPSFSEGKKKK